MNKEEILKKFLSLLEECVFVKSTNSITGCEESIENSIKDYEAIIEIKGQFDREDLKEILSNLASK